MSQVDYVDVIQTHDIEFGDLDQVQIALPLPAVANCNAGQRCISTRAYPPVLCPVVCTMVALLQGLMRAHLLAVAPQNPVVMLAPGRQRGDSSACGVARQGCSAAHRHHRPAAERLPEGLGQVSHPSLQQMFAHMQSRLPKQAAICKAGCQSRLPKLGFVSWRRLPWASN